MTPHRSFDSDYRSATPLSYRSKSYNSGLERSSWLSSSLDCSDSTWHSKLRSPLKSSLSRGSSSYSVHDLSHSDLFESNYNSSSVNAYSKHYSHHDAVTRDSRLTSRNRFKSRIPRSSRSRSANPLDQHTNLRYDSYVPSAHSYSRPSVRYPTFSRSLHDISSLNRSISRHSTPFHIDTKPTRTTTWYSRSLQELPQKFREHVTPIHLPAFDWSTSILNRPDYYLRALRNQRESCSSSRYHGHSYQHVPGKIDDDFHRTLKRFRERYAKSKAPIDFERRHSPPVFTGKMRGNQLHYSMIDFSFLFFNGQLFALENIISMFCVICSFFLNSVSCVVTENAEHLN